MSSGGTGVERKWRTSRRQRRRDSKSGASTYFLGSHGMLKTSKVCPFAGHLIGNLVRFQDCPAAVTGNESGEITLAWSFELGSGRE